MKITKIYVGGWFQRTTLHLSEIHDFVKDAYSGLDLEKGKLKKLHAALGIKDIELKKGALDNSHFRTTGGLDVNIFEDGLILLGNDSPGDAHENIKELTTYYEKKISPALSYIFSLGAPIPKELADIKTVYPYFVVLDNATADDVESLLGEFGQSKYFEVKEASFEIYRGDKLYIINNKSEDIANIEKFVSEQIFMREFKSQMHRYLNLHRIIWEQIAAVKERGKIKGSEIGGFKTKVERYQKTINLIEARINQMGLYVGTRESIADSDKGMEPFRAVLHYKYETLSNTLTYLKGIWSMTKNYVNSALGVFSDLQARSTNSSVKKLTVVTSMGVGASLIALFTKSAPNFTKFGFLYFMILVFVGWGSNWLMKYIAKRKSYGIKNVEADTNIHWDK